MVYRTTNENYGIIVDNENPHVLADINQHGHYRSLSFGTVFPLADGERLRYKIDVYSKDPQTVRSHISQHIIFAAETYKDHTISFIACIDSCFNSEHFNIFDDFLKAGLTATVNTDGKCWQYQLIASVQFQDYLQNITCKGIRDIAV